MGRIAAVIASAVLVVAACSGVTPDGSGSPASPPTPTGTAQPATSPTAEATRASDCVPGTLPVRIYPYLVSIGGGSDCTGSLDVRLAGWVAADPTRPYRSFEPHVVEPTWLRESIRIYGGDLSDPDCAGLLCRAFLDVAVDPAATVSLPEGGGWVQVAGRTSDPRAAVCTWSAANVGTSCLGIFVMTALSPADHPAFDRATCPTSSAESPRTMAAYLVTDWTCFGGREVWLLGWEGPPGGDAGVSPFSPVPAWLAGLPHAALFAIPCDPGAECYRGFAVYFDPAAGLDLSAVDRGRYLLVSGHRHDPAAATCHYDASQAAFSPAPEELAASEVELRLQCADDFVVTSIVPLPAPSPTP